MRAVSGKWSGRFPVLLAGAVLLLIATLAWFGYRAVIGWRASAAIVAERRADELATLLVSAITRDMRSVQTVVLPSVQADQFLLDPPYDVSDVAAGAFARYPYPESFFAWRGDPTPQSVLFFNRADRRPGWAADPHMASRFPVVVESHPDVARQLIGHILADAAKGRRFSAFNMSLNGVPYQIVTRLLYRDPLREQLEAAFGFTVNLSWVRTYYFTELTQQIARIGNASGLSLFVRDDRGRRVAAAPRSASGAVSVHREFAMTYFDPLVDEHDSTPALWVVETGVAGDATLAEAVRAGDRTLLMLAFAAAALAMGLILTLRATRDSARVAELRSDFVSTVTHELKTPIATIRAIGDTLARERVTDSESRLQYAQLVVQESKRLSRLVDNLLAYSRITDVTEVYSFEPVDLASIVEDALRGFRTQLQEKHFEVRVDIDPELPPIRADLAALTLAVDNVLDNAIRYSAGNCAIEIAGRLDGKRAAFEVRDHGIGIPPAEIKRVTQRFHRAPGTGTGGSGLGLSIVKRVIFDHGGELAIGSTVNEGTTVRISLPLAVHG